MVSESTFIGFILISIGFIVGFFVPGWIDDKRRLIKKSFVVGIFIGSLLGAGALTIENRMPALFILVEIFRVGITFLEIALAFIIGNYLGEVSRKKLDGVSS